MAVVTYTGAQRTRPQVDTVTIGSATAAETFTLAAGPTRTITYTAGSGETTTTVAAALWALFVAAQDTDGEFAELDPGSTAPTSASFTVTGPADGAPFTLTAGGTGTISVSTTTAALSPHDAGDVANYSTGALPVDATDSLVFEDSAVDCLYNLDALAALMLASPGLIRRASYTGRIGLPTTNANGYPEYRVSELQVKADTYFVEQAGDSAQQIRIRNMYSGGAVTLTVAGDGGGQVGAEASEVRGLPASSVANITGGSVAFAPLSGQACTVATLLAVNSTVRVGPDATLSGTVSLTDCQAQIKASWTTSLTVDGNSDVEVAGSAAGPAVVIEGGTVTWHSTGNPGSGCIVGSNGTLDLSTAPKALTIGGAISVYEGYTILDPAGRGGNFAVTPVHCSLQDGTLTVANGGTWTRS